MKKSRIHRISYHLVAGIRGRQLLLDSDLRREMVAEWRHGASWRGSEASFFGHEADLRVFAASLELERLGLFLLGQGSPVGAARAFADAARVSLCGEAYDHGEVSLPARFLRIRFYALLDRLRECLSADLRLQGRGIAPDLLAEARRLGGEFL